MNIDTISQAVWYGHSMQFKDSVSRLFKKNFFYQSAIILMLKLDQFQVLQTKKLREQKKTYVRDL